MTPDSQQNDSHEGSIQRLPEQPQDTHLVYSSGKKVIQPLSNDLKFESLASQSVAVTPPLPTVESMQTSHSPTTPIQPEQAVTLQPVRPDMSTIYPEATKGINGNAGTSDHVTIPSFSDVAAVTSEATYYDGYVIGGTVYFYQFVAGLVLGLLATFFLREIHTAIILTVSYVFSYLILLYLPYHVLQSNGLKKPVWLTMFGFAIQSVISVVGLFADALVTRLMFTLGFVIPVYASILIAISTLVASYYLTKFSWGIAFLLASKIKNKLVYRLVGSALVLVFTGLITYHFLAVQHIEAKTAPSNIFASSVKPVDLVSYHAAGRTPFSVNFYQGSRASISSSGEGIITYANNRGIRQATISVVSEPTMNISTDCTADGASSQFSFITQGTGGMVCVYSGAIQSYQGHVTLNGRDYAIYLMGYSYQQSLPTVKSILNSIIFT